jgi:hydrogenase maturation protein HypF
MTPDRTARQIQVQGIVQGVGFRPFVYSLARARGLVGHVANTADGVLIHVEGPPEKIARFEADLTREAPPLALVTGVTSHTAAMAHFPDFAILPSQGAREKTTLISPDVATCPACLEELFDPADRRHRYPFINCTNCGPRYTIIAEVPYDRPHTSMRAFRMCDRCQSEYDDPGNRRFHAQPNACWDCGPRMALWDDRGRDVEAADPIHQAAQWLSAGRILAVKGLGGFHLAVDAANEEAVRRLRRRKRRDEKPLALMAASLEAIRAFARICPEDAVLLTCPQRPIVLLPKREPNPLAPSVAPDNRFFGAMLPYTPVHHLLLSAAAQLTLVMTSGNLSEEPIAIANQEAVTRLGAIADGFLVHDRDIYLRSDDSLVTRADGQVRFLRRSRGYVPVPVFLRAPVPSVLALGAELKNTVCLTKEDRAFVSQHIGDLENLATYDFFRMTIAHLQRLLDIHPRVIACDRHPDYLSTRYALEQTELPVVQVQHHHAHVVSAMAENHLADGPVIGLAFDGTGYGDDGSVWGGEILVADARGYERVASLAAVPMPGSAAAVREPWRMAVSYLAAALGDTCLERPLPLLRTVEPGRAALVLEMVRKRINAPLTSSLGRLFDAVAGIAGVCPRVAFEGQAAMGLEMLATGAPSTPYAFQWTPQDIYRLDTRPIIRGVVADLEAGIALAAIADRFHATLVAGFAAICLRIRRERGLGRVVFSGGAFQNRLLLTGLGRALRAEGFEVFSHRLVPTNDGGLALGQALVAAASLGRRTVG